MKKKKKGTGVSEMPLKSTTSEQETLENLTFLYVEKQGDFKKIIQEAWKEFTTNYNGIFKGIPKDAKFNVVGVYKTNPPVYRVGVLMDKPYSFKGLQNGEIGPMTYAKYTVLGSYANLPALSKTAWELAARDHTIDRNAWTIERYINDPCDTAEEDLITDILIPIRKLSCFSGIKFRLLSLIRRK